MRCHAPWVWQYWILDVHDPWWADEVDWGNKRERKEGKKIKKTLLEYTEDIEKQEDIVLINSLVDSKKSIEKILEYIKVEHPNVSSDVLNIIKSSTIENLKANLDTNSTIVLQKINSHMRKDLVSSFVYGLYYISLIEEEERKKKNRDWSKSQYSFLN